MAHDDIGSKSMSKLCSPIDDNFTFFVFVEMFLEFFFQCLESIDGR